MARKSGQQLEFGSHQTNKQCAQNQQEPPECSGRAAKLISYRLFICSYVMQGAAHVFAVVGICLASHIFLSLMFAGAGFGGIWAFYAFPSVVFFLLFSGFAVKTIAKPADTKWLYGKPKYWFAILLGALLTGCALGFHLPTVVQFQSTTKLASVSELQGEPESIEFVNGAIPVFPAISNATISELGVHQQEFEERNTGTGNIPEACYLAVGLGDLAKPELPAGGFSITVGCSAAGRCTDVAVVSACLQQLRSKCSPCNPAGAVPVGKLPWHRRMSDEFPQAAIDDFAAKNTVSTRGFTHVEFLDFAADIRNSEGIMVGCGIAGFALTALLAAWHALRDRATVASEPLKTRSEIEKEASAAQIDVTKVETGMGPS